MSELTTAAPARPRMLYFHGPWGYLGNRMREAYVKPFEQFLRLHFDVVAIEGDADVGREIEEHAPEVIFFHAGCEAVGEEHKKLTNVAAYPEIPRAGWLWQDPFTPSRLIGLQRLQAWKVDRVFSCFHASDRIGDSLADILWIPWWVDPSRFRDYGLEKDVPVLLSGAGWQSGELYPWRHDVAQSLLSKVPVMHLPSQSVIETTHVVGEAYARWLNRSWFAAGCGGAGNFLVMKLLEIPAARSCLVTKRTAVLDYMGFRDGENCLMVAGSEAAEKIEAYLADEDRLRAIIASGARLVTDHHTGKQRTHVLDWWKLRAAGAPEASIFQDDPFGSLQSRDGGSANNLPWASDNPFPAGVVQAYAQLEAGNLQQADALFGKVLLGYNYFAEAHLGKAITKMRLGDFNAAVPHLSQNLSFLRRFDAEQPDPVDLGLMLALCACKAKAGEVERLLETFGMANHPLPKVVLRLAGLPCPETELAPAPTLHPLSYQTEAEWEQFLVEFMEFEFPQPQRGVA